MYFGDSKADKSKISLPDFKKLAPPSANVTKNISPVLNAVVDPTKVTDHVMVGTIAVPLRTPLVKLEPGLDFGVDAAVTIKGIDERGLKRLLVGLDEDRNPVKIKVGTSYSFI